MQLKPFIGIVPLAVLLFASVARAAPSDDACIEASDKSIVLRKAGKLLEARAELASCSDSACPEVVRVSCEQRLLQLNLAVPTIVFDAKDASGNDLGNVKVMMDGAPLADRLDGSALTIEPGEHTFELTSPGYAAVSKKLVIHEGVKGRLEAITFGAPSEGSAPVPVAAPPPRAAEPDGSGRRTLAFALGGAGLVGIAFGTYFGILANVTYNDASSSTHCPTGPSSCDSDGIRGGRDAHTQATVSSIAFVAGGALLAGGVVLFLTAPKARAAAVQPIVAVGSGGVRVGGAW